jgi:hypothetical protein
VSLMIVSTSSRLVEEPFLNFNVTVPSVVGSHSIVHGSLALHTVPAVGLEIGFGELPAGGGSVGEVAVGAGALSDTSGEVSVAWGAAFTKLERADTAKMAAIEKKRMMMIIGFE